MSKKPNKTMLQRRRDMIRWYREETGKTEIDMHDVARFAFERGWEAPRPKDPIVRLAEQFSAAAREETRKDPRTGRPYRANLAVVHHTPEGQYTIWGDIDDVPRPFAQKSFTQRREHMVGEAVQLSLDVGHWNDTNSKEEPIRLELDFGDDVEERLASTEDEELEEEEPEMA